MRIAECVEVSAPPQAVWDYLAEPENYLRFMSGVTRWEVQGERRSGLQLQFTCPPDGELKRPFAFLLPLGEPIQNRLLASITVFYPGEVLPRCRPGRWTS